MTDEKTILAANGSVVTRQEAIDHLRLYGSVEENPVVDLFIAAATKIIENITGQVFGIATMEVEMLTSYRSVGFGVSPFIAVVSVKDAAGVDVTAGSYTVTMRNGLATFAFGTRQSGKVQYTAGNMVTKPNVKLAALLMIGAMYENREDSVSERTMSAADRILQPERYSIV